MREPPSSSLRPPSSPAAGWPPEAGARNARRVFWLLFVAVFAIKLMVAARLPVFVDEAFYWLEGQHLAPAYSDLPGLTAWLARLGVTLGGDTALGLRLPFLLIAALVCLALVACEPRGTPQKPKTIEDFVMFQPSGLRR